MKAYGGYCFFPDHPLSDLHGVVRFVIKTRSPILVGIALSKYGVELNHRELNKTWGESESKAEIEVTAKRYGDVFFCSPGSAYISTANYSYDRKLYLEHRQETQRQAQTEGHKVASAPRRSQRSVFP